MTVSQLSLQITRFQIISVLGLAFVPTTQGGFSDRDLNRKHREGRNIVE